MPDSRKTPMLDLALKALEDAGEGDHAGALRDMQADQVERERDARLHPDERFARAAASELGRMQEGQWLRTKLFDG